MDNFRNYFDRLLKENGYDLNKDGFYNGVSSTNFDNSYFLEYDVPEVDNDFNTCLKYTVNLSIEYFFSGDREVSDTIDEGYRKVNDMMIKFINSKNIYNHNNNSSNQPLEVVEPGPINHRSLDNNKRNIVFKNNLTVEFYYELCSNE